MGFESNEEKREQNTVETQFEGGGVDMESGDLSAASPVTAPKRSLRERRAVRARAVDPSAQPGRSAAGAAQPGRRAGASGNNTGTPPVRKPIMRSNSEFGYLFSDSEPVDNHMDETYSQRLNGLAYDGKKRGDEAEYAELFEGQQSMVRRPENRMSAPAGTFEAHQQPQEAPAETGRRPRFSRRSQEHSSAAAYAAANEVSAAELAARIEPEPAAEPAQQTQPELSPYDRQADHGYPRREDNYIPRDRRYEDDYSDDYSYRGRGIRHDYRGGYEPQPEYPPYGYPPAAYPPGYPYPYPYGQYPPYPPYGQYPAYPPYGYPPAAYPPGYPYPMQTQEPQAVSTAPVPDEPPAAAAVDPVIPSITFAEPEPEKPEPVPVPPEPVIQFPDDSSDSVDEEFAGLDYTPSRNYEKRSEAPKQPEAAEEPTASAEPAVGRSSGSSRFNRRSRSSGPSSDNEPAQADPVPASEPSAQKAASGEPDPVRRSSRRAAKEFDWSDSSSPAKDSTDWFSSDSSSTDISKAGGSSRFNRRSRS